jgi:hypothetical protein
VEVLDELGRTRVQGRVLDVVKGLIALFAAALAIPFVEKMLRRNGDREKKIL